jgi:hypothetical protein
MGDVTTQELEGQLELSRERFTQVTEQIRSVLVADASAFLSKSCRQAFLTQADAADALDDARLKGFKGRATAVGAAAASRIEETLSDPAVWLSGANTTSEERSLNDAVGVWSVVQTVEADGRALLSEFGFEPERLSYAPPKYFVGGLYLPTLVEHYWRLRQEMGGLEQQCADLVAQATRDRLQARWDDA